MIEWLKRRLGVCSSHGLLSNAEIRQELESVDSEFRISPLREHQIQPASVDLRLGDQFKRYRSDDATSCLIDSRDGVWDDLHEEIEAESIVVRPEDFVLATTVEELTLPADIYGEVKGRSSFGRLGIEVHKTAGVIDPGWQGEITLEITNAMPYPVELHVGQRVCQVTFTRLREPADPPYGEKYDSKYQDQHGPTTSRADGDLDGDVEMNGLGINFRKV